MICELKEKERLAAIDNAITIIRRNLPLYTYKCQDANTVDGIYKAIDNIEWTTGFWPGELWLAYLESGDETFAHAAGIAVESFRDRIRDHIAVDHHDMGFLYTPSCVAAWMIKKDAHAREAAIAAADNLVSRFQEKGQFIQAWGKMGADDNYSKSVSRVAVLRWLSDILSGDTLGAVKKEIKEKDFPTYRMLYNQWLGADSFSVDAVCLEKPDLCIKDIKEKAIHWLDCTGDSDWNSLSAACDAFFSDQNAAAGSMEASVSVALAYPNYESPVFTVSVTETDADWKRGSDV